jgi:NAD(P)-dependent dehydrogenase (short-subunit alcohol dehydrogenase family)
LSSAGIDAPRDDHRVALVTRAGAYVGPALSWALAAAEHHLVLHEPGVGQAEALRAAGATVEVVDEAVVPLSGPGSIATAEGCHALVARTLEVFGRLDAAAVFPPAGGPTAYAQGPFLDAEVSELRSLCTYFETTFHILRALVPPMQAVKSGQIVVFTSDAGARPEAGWSLYGAVRAGQSFLVRAVALEHAADGICINVIGSKNAIFPGFPLAPDDAITDARIISGSWAAPLEAETPSHRLGTMEELAAFATVLLDGRNRFQTAQYFSFSGGWSSL